MSYSEYSASSRTEFGSKAADRYRAAGQVPVSVNTSGGDSLALLVGEHDAAKIAGQVGRVVVLDAGEAKHQILVQAVDAHPLTDRLRHIDALAVTDDKSVRVRVPLVPNTSDSPGLKAGGMLEQMLRKLEVRAPAGKIPDQIEIILAGRGIAETVYAEDLELPEGVTCLTRGRTALITIAKTRAMRRAEGSSEDEEG